MIGVVSAAGVLTERYEYTPYGQRTVFSRGWYLEDVDFDGDVDSDDRTIIANDMEEGGTPDHVGDLDGDGSVTTTDWNFCYDANGSSIAADDPLVMHPRLESFRSPLYAGAGISLCDVGHQGLMHDKEFGLSYNRARYLHPILGRFTGRDPKRYVDGMNLYEYVRSESVTMRDPTGLITMKTENKDIRDAYRKLARVS